MKNEGWKWDVVKDEVWKRPCEESYYYALRWKDKGFRKILDIGSGLGRHSLHFAKFGFDVSSIDISEEAVNRTKEALESNGYVQNCKKADFRALPFENNEFDAVFSFLTLSHTNYDGIIKALDEIHRVVQLGGEIFITINSQESGVFKNSKYEKIDEYTVIKDNDGPEKGEPHFYANADLVKDLLKDYKILWLRHAQDIIYNMENYGGWNYFVHARKESI
ncbi:class I SAM-dependent methyltransferase [Lachnospiraceae bacterium OttesenSCG-928-D06]|nr:class I SAM-dependent methyltransferase [Lachnospiraceae bacterium OttesenSCG-928-D06]